MLHNNTGERFRLAKCLLRLHQHQLIINYLQLTTVWKIEIAVGSPKVVPINKLYSPSLVHPSPSPAKELVRTYSNRPSQPVGTLEFRPSSGERLIFVGTRARTVTFLKPVQLECPTITRRNRLTGVHRISDYSYGEHTVFN